MPKIAYFFIFLKAELEKHWLYDVHQWQKYEINAVILHICFYYLKDIFVYSKNNNFVIK